MRHASAMVLRGSASGWAAPALIRAERAAWSGPAKPASFCYIVDRATGALQARIDAMRAGEAAIRKEVLATLAAAETLPLL